LATESYLDTGNRAAFANGGAVVMAHADFARGVWAAEACAALVADGPVLAATQARLLARAEMLGHGQTSDPDLHLVVDGQRIEARRDGARYVWDIPAGPVRLCSRSGPPAWVEAGCRDHRRLGVPVGRLRLDGADVSPAALGAGWHAAEADWQWTDGDATLHPGAGRLEVTLASTAHRYRTPGALRRAA
jgi:hypothetical protein